ncbi:MAG: HAMP domain-containing sensor histidine kinase [Sandaracinus sp.]
MTITLRVVIAIAVASLSASLALVFFAQEMQRETIEARLADAVTAAMSAGAREQCEADPVRFVSRSAERAQRAERRGRRPRARLGSIVGARYAVFDHAGQSATGAPSLDPSLVAALDRETIVALPEQGGVARYLVHMPWSDGPCAIVGVERASPTELDVVRRRGLWLSLVVLAVASLAAVLALRTPLARLRSLTEAAGLLGRSGFRDRTALDRAAATGRGDEVGALTASLRDAVDRIAADASRLSARDVALTEYVAHTTHDLMTPVTVLTGQLAELEEDLARGQRVEPRTVARAIAEAHYLATLIANLGVVARLDRPDPIVQKRAIDLRDVIERVAARHEPLARARGLVLEHAVSEAPCPLEADDLWLERALGNLVHNAIRHHTTREGSEGHVALVLAQRDGAFEVRVIDDGRGLDDVALRALAEGAEGAHAASDDAARTRKHGFGMDVVRRVAAVHGLSLRVARADEGGLSVTLSGHVTQT